MNMNNDPRQFQSEPYACTEADGKVTITGFDESLGGDITIPATLGGHPVTAIGARAFQGCSGVTSVIIPEGVTRIGERAFWDCSGLSFVILPDSVTSIGDHAFYECTGLTAVAIPAGVTSIGDQAFSCCTVMTSIAVAPDNPAYSSVDGILFDKDRALLIQCPAGKSGPVAIPAGVAGIGHHAFYECTGVTAITIPEGVTSIGDRAFWECTALASVTIPASVTGIGYCVFYRCTSLAGAVFLGDAPAMGALVFSGVASGFTVRHPKGRGGFTAPAWKVYRVAELDA